MIEAPRGRDRLLKAWRGEILAGAVYELIARRLPTARPRSCGGWRGRERPPPAAGGSGCASWRSRSRRRTVKVPVWLRLQARVAPIDRLLAAREAAEDDEVDDLYKRSTGDPDTDRLLRDIRREERSHSLAVQDMRAGSRHGATAAAGDR